MVSSRCIIWILMIALLGLTSCGYNGTLLADNALYQFLGAIGTQSGNAFVTHLQPFSNLGSGK